MDQIAQLIEDFEFAQETPDLSNMAEVLRYVAAINPEASLKQFVEAAETCGYRRNTAGNRFRESRAFDAENQD